MDLNTPIFVPAVKPLLKRKTPTAFFWLVPGTTEGVEGKLAGAVWTTFAAEKRNDGGLGAR